ncbi:MAG: CbiX/SirB N-terminal domain-containing protein [Betaproteobacteria bacterium]|nr:CbiX/SirB N-terminal domain-containing protein [Betaproteobacteria bacterium]
MGLAIEPPAILLLAHGSPEPGWALPFEAIRARVAALRADAPVGLAFLPPATPGFDDVVGNLIEGGARRLVVVPLFLARGGHVVRDLPAMADAARTRLGIGISIAPVLGESDAMREAIAQWAVAATVAVSNDA